MKHGIAQSIRDQRRERILQTARDVFFEEGYSAATMSMIAARLGGSKATLYAYFKNKEDLFDEIIRDQCSIIRSTLGLADEGADVRTTLTALGFELTTALNSDWAIRTLQLVMEESVRNPDLALRFDQAGPRLGAEGIAAYLAGAHQRGQIYAPDPLSAAQVLASLLKGDLHFRRMLGLEPEPTPEVIAAQVETAVNVFLAAYAPRPR